MMLGGIWVVMDKQAWEIFDLWFKGKAPSDVTFDSAEWASYMGAAEGLSEQIRNQLTAHAESLRDLVNRAGNQQDNFHVNFHAEVGGKYGGYTTGYQVLHGSNRNVGDFEITGRFTAVRRGVPGTAYTVTYDNLVFIFNDIVDINKQYKMDVSLGQVAANMARCLDTGPPKDYVLHIKWAATKPTNVEVEPTLQTQAPRKRGATAN